MKQKELKISLSAKYVQAKQIVEFIVLALDDKNKFKPLHLWDYYPGLFEKEKEEYEVVQEREDFQRYKEMRETFVNYRNKSIGGE